MNSSPLIDIQDITYTYPTPGKSKDKAQLPAALQNVSLQVQQGEYLVVLGHNGSGKSTLAHHCNALLIPDSGRVLVAGFDTGDKARRPNIRDSVGMIFQNPDNQIIATVVEDDVAWALTVRGFSASLIEERVSYALAAVGITDLRKLPPHRLMEGTPANIFTDLERLRQLKLSIPEPIELATRLRGAGLSISREALTVEAIAREIMQ